VLDRDCVPDFDTLARANTTSGRSLRLRCSPPTAKTSARCRSRCARPNSRGYSRARSMESLSPSTSKATSARICSASPATWASRESSRSASIALMAPGSAPTDQNQECPPGVQQGQGKSALVTSFTQVRVVPAAAWPKVCVRLSFSFSDRAHTPHFCSAIGAFSSAVTAGDMKQSYGRGFVRRGCLTNIDPLVTFFAKHEEVPSALKVVFGHGNHLRLESAPARAAIDRFSLCPATVGPRGLKRIAYKKSPPLSYTTICT
jgi:hypothetical protein